MNWELPCDPDVVIFNAEVLGECSTARPGARRWVQMTLVGTEEAYFLYGVGKSAVPGEDDRPWGKWLAEPFLVVRALLSSPDTSRNSTVSAAREMLGQAALLDEGIAGALAEWRG